MANLRMFATIEVNNETGGWSAVYFRIRQGKVAETREFAGGDAFADYDRKGELLGLEFLAPCSVDVLDKIVRREPRAVKRFLVQGLAKTLAHT